MFTPHFRVLQRGIISLVSTFFNIFIPTSLKLVYVDIKISIKYNNRYKFTSNRFTFCKDKSLTGGIN